VKEAFWVRRSELSQVVRDVEIERVASGRIELGVFGSIANLVDGQYKVRRQP
jgi:hypothetical protein